MMVRSGVGEPAPGVDVGTAVTVTGRTVMNGVGVFVAPGPPGVLVGRGVFVTLSHYCPTAASLLVSYEGPVTIVEGPEPIPHGDPEGYDARGAWPPLLAPNVLMDLDAYGQWESHLIAWLGGVRNAGGQWAPEDVLHMLDEHAARIGSWPATL